MKKTIRAFAVFGTLVASSFVLSPDKVHKWDRAIFGDGKSVNAEEQKAAADKIRFKSAWSQDEIGVGR